MEPITISSRFAAQCSPVISSSYDTCGSVTKTTIDHLTPTDLAALFQPGGLFADLDAWFHHSIEMLACGTKTYAWYDWIMANADRGGQFTAAYRTAVAPGIRAAKGPGLLQPFIMGRQQSVINRDYWKMVNSIRDDDYTINQPANGVGTMTGGPLTSKTGGTAIIRVTSQGSVPLDAAYFLSRHNIHLFTYTTNRAQHGTWRVVGAAVDTAKTYIDILVTDLPVEVSEDTGTGMNSGSGINYFDVATTGASSKNGLIVEGINNVHDFESWCHNRVNLDGKKMVPFWYQTYRRTRCVDSNYMAVFNRLRTSLVNRAFQEFGDIDIAERNRQDELEAQKEFVHSFFFQMPISSNQTLTNWESLGSIVPVTEVGLTPGLPGGTQARRANWIGVREQLRQCSRIRDLSRNPLNLLEFFQYVYDIKRARETAGKTVTSIDFFTNAFFRDLFHRAMIEYYKNLYSDGLRWVVNIGSRHEQLGMIFDTYTVTHPAGVNINIISSNFFDDWYTQNNDVGNGDAANMLLALDIGKPGAGGGTIYYAQLAGNRRMHKTADLQQLASLDETFRCVMEITSKDTTLTSETGTVVVECPLHSLWIENIQMTKPVVTGKTVPYTDLY